MHNHTLLSDGDGDPELAFASMRAAGLDVAALTDHATISEKLALADACSVVYPEQIAAGCRSLRGLTPEGWARTAAYADANDEPGKFTAIRGFEWSEPYLGHVNVWFTQDYTDVVDLGDMDPFYRWLTRSNGLLGGGDDGIAGFNHPGRERGRFSEFGYDAAAAAQMVSLEMFNRRDDYLFEGHADRKPSPLSACLGAGWRTGLLGVTDEHGTDWGVPEGKGRGGLWVTEQSRRGVFEAMRARRFFATRESGLRVDATAGKVRMGGTLVHTAGLVEVRLDVDRGDDWLGLPLEAQVLRPGDMVPRVSEVVPFRCGDVVRFRVPVDLAEGDWMVVRIADPSRPNATPGPAGHPANNYGVAYTSPWFLRPS